MVLRVTNKLAKKLKITPSRDYTNQINPFQEWYGHLFIFNRIQYIIFTNAYTLYSAVVPGKGIINTRTFIDFTGYWLNEALKADGCENIMKQFITPCFEDIDLCKTNNRHVIDSMNEMINFSRFFFAERSSSPAEVSKYINSLIYGYIKYETPLSLIRQIAAIK